MKPTLTSNPNHDFSPTPSEQNEHSSQELLAHWGVEVRVTGRVIIRVRVRVRGRVRVGVRVRVRVRARLGLGLGDYFLRLHTSFSIVGLAR